MTGIERLRSMAARHNFLEPEEARKMWDIADQIEREQACDSDTSENVRLVVGGVVTDMERHVLGHEGMEDSPVARWARELRKALGGGERDHAEDVSMSAYDLLPKEDREAIAWVREHGGIAKVKEEWNHSRNLKRSLETAQAKVERQQRHIMFVQTKCRERQEHICELNKLKRAYVDALNGVCKRLGLTDGTGMPDMPEVIWTELDRRLMPEGMEWPKVDGEPVEIGERLVGYGSGDDGYEVVGVRPTCGWVLVKSRDHITRDGGPVTLEWDASKCHRPAPKVLDADGVEIRVGDTVWATNGHGPFEVTRIVNADRLRVICDDEKNGHLNVYPENITHRAPVLAADGRLLREGEKPYRVDNGKQVEIRRIDPSNGESCVFVGVDGRLYGYWLRPGQLTHERHERMCRDCAHWQKDPTADNMGVCWFLYHEYEGEDCYAARTGGRDACEEFVRRAERLAERGR